MHRNCTLQIPEELRVKASKYGLNMSGVARRALSAEIARLEREEREAQGGEQP